jgi:hypothetical protein
MHTDLDNHPESHQIYRCWVQIRHRIDGSARTLPLRAVRLVHIPNRKAATPSPDEQRLELLDDSTVIQARDLEELAAELRRRYPDETHEQRLCWERDREEERRRADALKSFIELLAEAVARAVLSGHAIHSSPPDET